MFICIKVASAVQEESGSLFTGVCQPATEPKEVLDEGFETSSPVKTSETEEELSYDEFNVYHEYGEGVEYGEYGDKSEPLNPEETLGEIKDEETNISENVTEPEQSAAATLTDPMQPESYETKQNTNASKEIKENSSSEKSLLEKIKSHFFPEEQYDKEDPLDSIEKEKSLLDIIKSHFFPKEQRKSLEKTKLREELEEQEKILMEVSKPEKTSENTKLEHETKEHSTVSRLHETEKPDVAQKTEKNKLVQKSMFEKIKEHFISEQQETKDKNVVKPKSLMEKIKKRFLSTEEDKEYRSAQKLIFDKGGLNHRNPLDTSNGQERGHIEDSEEEKAFSA